MKKGKKIAVILSVCLMVTGLCLGAVSLFALDFDFEALSTEEFTTSTHTVTQAFENIRIKTDTAHLRFLYTADKSDAVVVLEEGSSKHSVSVKNGTLHITERPDRHWWELLQVNFRSPSITVYLPQSAYQSLSVETDTADIVVSALQFNSVQLETDTGDMNLIDIAVEANLKLETDTGDILLEASTADALSVDTDTGDVTFDGFSAQGIRVETDTGDVEGVLTGQMVFDVKTRTGDVDVPYSNAGGTCRIRTETGDVQLQTQ